MNTLIPLMKFLARLCTEHGAGDHVYVVGGAVRNHLLGAPIKDLDITIDTVGLGDGRDSAWLAETIARAIGGQTNLTTNQYGVAIITAKDPEVEFVADGEVIEIANARKESYGGEGGKGYKPHLVEPATILEDVVRREFTFNTLLWRMRDLLQGPEGAEVIDLTGRGVEDLRAGVMRTPAHPDKTFTDDPTRMIRAAKFGRRYGFTLAPEALESIRRNAGTLRNVPHNAVSTLLTSSVLHEEPDKGVEWLRHLGLLDVLRSMVLAEPAFKATLESFVHGRVHTLLALRTAGLLLDGGLGFLSETQFERLAEVAAGLESHTAQALVEALRQPGKVLDTSEVMAKTGLRGKELARMTSEARVALLAAPGLREDRSMLTARVVQALSAPAS